MPNLCIMTDMKKKRTTSKRRHAGGAPGRETTWRSIRRKLPLLLLIPLGLLWPRICMANPAWIERVYSTGVYPAIRDALSSITSLIPISVAELLLYALALWALAAVIGGLIAWASGRVGGKRVLTTLISIGVAIGVILNLFYFTWGFNYFRAPLKARMGLTVCPRPVEELESLAFGLAAQAAALRPALPENEDGVFTLGGALPTVLADLPAAYRALAEEQPVFSGRTTRAKRVLYSEGLSWAGISGIFIGLTGEPNINAAQPDLLLPQAAAHEMAHQLGIASENEAEFAANLACFHSTDARVRYSGLMNALMNCTNALYAADPARYEALTGVYSQGMLRDLRNDRAYWAQYDGPIEAAVTQTNDRYLKHNAQESGIKSYGESVDLLLAYYDLTKN